MKFKIGDKVKTLDQPLFMLFPIGTIGTIINSTDYDYQVKAEVDGVTESWFYAEKSLELYESLPYPVPTHNPHDFKVPEESRVKMFAANGMKSVIRRCKRREQVVVRVNRMMGIV